MKLVSKTIKAIKIGGFKYTFRKIKNYINERLPKRGKHIQYCISKKQLLNERNYEFESNLKFSIVVPLFNTKTNYLLEMINSVIQQSYGNWELCLVDASDCTSIGIANAIDKFKDPRIKYKKLNNNKGISDNTNEALKIATGDYIGLLDHDDVLHPSALFECMKVIISEKADFIYSDEATFTKKIKNAYSPNYKPDYSPDTLRSYNYICHFSVFNRKFYDEGIKFRSEFDGSQDYDLILRITEKADRIYHIPKVLYFWRAHKESVALDIEAKPYAIESAKKALCEHLDRIGLIGEVKDSKVLSTYKIEYKISELSLISIIIANKDHVEDLEKCVNSIIDKTTYPNYEIIIVENNSTEKETFKYYEELIKTPNINVIFWGGKFNYSSINNYAVKQCNGKILLLLNNDVEIITNNWLEEMLMYAQRKDVGAVGAMLYYPDDSIQHAGVILGIGDPNGKPVAGHSHKGYQRDDYGFMSRLTIAQNLSAVTAACMMIRREVYEEVNGLDANFAVAFNDVDLCMKIREKGYLNVFTPYAELYHYESKSRGKEDNNDKIKRFNSEVEKFYEKWEYDLMKGDPYYNPNLSTQNEDFGYRN